MASLRAKAVLLLVVASATPAASFYAPLHAPRHTSPRLQIQPALPPEGGTATRPSLRELPRQLLQRSVAMAKRADASLACGILAGFVAFNAFPLIEYLVAKTAMMPLKKGGLGSGFTTDVWGAFCPAVGILFATLISSTVDKLWARQEALRKDLVAEASLLASLTQLLDEADLAEEEVAKRAARESEVALAQGFKYAGAAVDISAAAKDVTEAVAEDAHAASDGLTTAASHDRHHAHTSEHDVGGASADVDGSSGEGAADDREDWLERQAAATAADKTERLERATHGMEPPPEDGSPLDRTGYGGGKGDERAGASNVQRSQQSFRCIAPSRSPRARRSHRTVS